MAAPRFGVALAGLGPWGRNHLRAILQEPRAALRWLVDPDPATIAAAAGTADVRRGAELAPVLDDAHVDLVVIASPARTHHELASAALAAGKHVLVEKPLSLELRVAQELVQAATAARRVLAVGHVMLYEPAVVRLHELVRAGAFGTLRYAHGVRVNRGRVRSDESALWSLGPHDLAILDYLLGELPTTVNANGHTHPARSVPDVVFASLTYRSGFAAGLHWSWLAPRRERRLTLVGSDGSAVLEDANTHPLTVFGSPEPGLGVQPTPTVGHGIEVERQEPLRALLADVLSSIETGLPPRAGSQHALRVIRVLDAAQRSLQGHGSPAVPFDEV